MSLKTFIHKQKKKLQLFFYVENLNQIKTQYKKAYDNYIDTYYKYGTASRRNFDFDIALQEQKMHLSLINQLDTVRQSFFWADCITLGYRGKNIPHYVKNKPQSVKEVISFLDEVIKINRSSL